MLFRYLKRAFLPLILLLAAGCAGPDIDAVFEDLRSAAPSGRLVEGVPFFPQDAYMCGPAALASVTGYWGARAGMKEIASEVYEARLKGALPMDLLIYAKEHGFEASYYTGGLGDLKEKLESGYPLILFLNLGFDFYPVGHYVVAVGFSERHRAVIAHSGMEKERTFRFEELEKAWSKTGYSTLLIRPRSGSQGPSSRSSSRLAPPDAPSTW